MYTEEMLESIKKVEATRDERLHTEPRRLSADEKDALLRRWHPDYREDAFAEIKVGPNRGEKAPKQLTHLLHSNSRLYGLNLDLSRIDYDTDVLIIGGGGAGCSAAIEASNAGANVLVVTKLRLGDANTMMAEGGIQAADKPNDSPVQHYLDAYGGGHFAAKPELVKELVSRAPEAIQWLENMGVMFDKEADGTMVTTHGGGTSRKRMHAARDYSGAEIMRVLRDEVQNRGIQVLEFTSAAELIKDTRGQVAGAVLMNMETDDYLVCRAKTVILATGGCGRLHYQHFPTSNHYGATADGLILAYRFMSKRFVVKTIFTVTLMTLLLTVIPIPKEPILQEPIGNCLIAGILGGAGIGLVLRTGSCDGGMDLIGMILIQTKGNMSVGRVNIFCNCILYGICLVLFDMQIAIYSLIYSVISSMTCDRVHTQNINAQVMIITKMEDVTRLEIEIMGQMHRGLTKWGATGSYTGDSATILMAIVSKYEITQLKTIVHSIDPHAFVMIDEDVNVDGHFLKKLT